MQKLTMEEFISTTISSEDGWPCSSRPRSICDIMEESHITPWVECEILHPQLPILKITAHADQTLPLAPAGLEKSSPDDAMSTRYSVSFVISLQNRWASFDDPNRWIIRFQGQLLLRKTLGAGSEAALPQLLGRHRLHAAPDHRAVLLTVHGKGGKMSVLKPGNYSRAPSIAHWEAPGHILTDEQTRIFDLAKVLGLGLESEQLTLEVWPNLNTPNAGFPLPGTCTHGTQAGTGDEDVEEVRDGGLRLVGSTP